MGFDDLCYSQNEILVIFALFFLYRSIAGGHGSLHVSDSLPFNWKDDCKAASRERFFSM